MELFTSSLEIIFPLFFWMALGYGARRIFALDQNFLDTANRLVFNLFMPTLLFCSMLENDVAARMDRGLWGMLALVLGGIFATFLLLLWLVPRFEPQNPRRSVMILGIARGNTAIFGLPIASALYPGGDIGPVILAIGVGVIAFNALSVAAFEIFRGGRPKPLAILAGIVKNPLIIALVLGMACSLARLGLPGPLLGALGGVAAVTTPFAFIVLGAGFTFTSALGNRKSLAVALAGKLALVPLCWVGLAALLGLRGVPLAAVLTIFAPPTAVSLAPMAQEMGGDANLAREVVVFTSAFSVVTMFLWILGLRGVGVL